MSKILVTGCAGFIGSHIAEHLVNAGHEVAGLDDFSGGFNENVPNGLHEFFNQDICDHDIGWVVERVKPEYIVHCAAYAAEGLSHFIRRYNYTNNLIGSVNLINEAVKHDVKGFVFLSSIAVYGDQEPPFVEQMTPRPCDPYGIAKYAVEMDLAAAKEMFGLNYCIFRPHNVFGPRQNIADNYRNVIGIFMRQCLKGEPMTIFGDGEQTRGFSYIDDVAPQIAGVIDRNSSVRGQTFNIGGDYPCTVNQISKLVAEAMGVEHRVIHLPERKEVKHAFCLHGKLKQYGFEKAKTKLRDGIYEMAQWVKQSKLREPTPFSNIEVTKNLPPSWANLK